MLPQAHTHHSATMMTGCESQSFQDLTIFPNPPNSFTPLQTLTDFPPIYQIKIGMFDLSIQPNIKLLNDSFTKNWYLY